MAPIAAHLEVLISREQIASRLLELARAIARDFAGEPLLVVPVLEGASVFAHDLARLLPLEVTLDSIAVSSYGGGTGSNRRPRLARDLTHSIAGKNVLVVEDILDSGSTLNFVAPLLRSRHPQSLRIATLLDKPSRRVLAFTPDYVGFVIADRFVVGYGLDFNQQFRELPDICVLPEAAARP